MIREDGGRALQYGNGQGLPRLREQIPEVMALEGIDADPEDIRRWYLDRFLTLKRTAFREPGSYFQRYATVPDDIALAAADEVWESVNLANLRENIAPTRGRATLVLRKDADHHMTRVLLRKI